MTQKADTAQIPHTTANLAGVVILAGGQSRRMGFPKAQLSLPSHERLLDYHVRHASQLSVPIIIADNERGFTVAETLLEQLTAKAIPLLHIEDYRPVIIEGSTETAGALAAIAGAMQALVDVEDSSYLMVVSCDSLITAPELWQALSPYCDSNSVKTKIATETETNATIANNSVVCLTDDAYPYPLLALYRLELAANLCTYLDSGQRRVIEFIKPIAQPVLLPNEWLQLTNLNTPDDFKRACAQLWPASI
ncbi:molybdenum cofactor guanylyltransferase [Psychrobacter arenosus]|uniref:molybdenum cofactor guanylyltransferase n=1 Tax=Psychrobacter arenosus TaxID=256326 RepID=UPI00191A91C5|nr:NTP transferase domain-containing protein [Psychrobacter arenosus]